MPDTNEELKNKDEKNLIKEENGRVVDILELLDNPISLDPNIRRRLLVLQKYAKVSNETIAERYGEKTENIENLDKVNDTLLEICKVLALEESQKPNGIVFDQNGNYDKKASIEKAMKLGISDMYDVTADKISQNTNKYVNGNNKESDKLLENIFKEIEEKKNIKLSKNVEDLVNLSLGDSGFLERLGNAKEPKNKIELSLYEGELAVSIVKEEMEKLKEIDINSLDEKEKKSFLFKALGVCNARTEDEFLIDLNTILNKMYSGLSIFDSEKIASILEISEEEVRMLQAGAAAEEILIKSIDREYEDLVTKEYEILYYEAFLSPNADKSKLEKLKSEHPEYAEKFSEIEKKDFTDYSNVGNDILLHKEDIIKDVFTQMLDKLNNSNDELSNKEKKLFARQAIITLGTGGTNEEEKDKLDKILESLRKLYPEKTISIDDLGKFMEQAGEILDISSEEVSYLIQGGESDRMFEDSINYLKKYNRYKREQIMDGKSSEKIADEEIIDYIENEGVILEVNNQTNVKTKVEEIEFGNLSTEIKSFESKKSNMTEDINLEENANPGFFRTAIQKFKQAWDRITGKQKRLPEGNKIEDSNYNSSNISNSERSEKSQEELKPQNRNDNFIQTVQVNEQVAIETMKANKANKSASKEETEISI